MTERDITEIYRFLNKEDYRLTDTLVGLSNSYQMFKHYDELDFLEFLTVKIELTYKREMEKRLMALVKYLHEAI